MSSSDEVPSGLSWKLLVRAGIVPEAWIVDPKWRGPDLATHLGAFHFEPGGGFEVLSVEVECRQCLAPAGSRCGPITHRNRWDYACTVRSRIESRCPDPADLEPGRTYRELGNPFDPRPKKDQRERYQT